MPASASPYELHTPTLRAKSLKAEDMPYNLIYYPLDFFASSNLGGLLASTAADVLWVPLINAVYANQVGKNIKRDYEAAVKNTNKAFEEAAASAQQAKQEEARLKKTILDEAARQSSQPQQFSDQQPGQTNTDYSALLPILAGLTGGSGVGLLTNNALAGLLSGTGIGTLLWLLGQQSPGTANNYETKKAASTTGGFFDPKANPAGLISGLLQFTLFQALNWLFPSYMEGAIYPGAKGMNEVRKDALNFAYSSPHLTAGREEATAARFNALREIQALRTQQKFLNILRQTKPDVYKQVISNLADTYAKEPTTTTTEQTSDAVPGTAATTEQPTAATTAAEFGK